MRIGTMFFGRVEALEHEAIETKFFVLGVPLFPLESFYMTSTAYNGGTGIAIPLHGTSVLAAYLRIFSGLGALLSGLFFYIEHDSWDPQWGLLGLTIACVLTWIPSMFVLGKLSPAEKDRRLMLRALTGVGVPPEALSPETRELMLYDLEKAWTRCFPSKSWRERVGAGDCEPAEALLLKALKEFATDEPAVGSRAQATT